MKPKHSTDSTVSALLPPHVLQAAKTLADSLGIPFGKLVSRVCREEKATASWADGVMRSAPVSAGGAAWLDEKEKEEARQNEVRQTGLACEPVPLTWSNILITAEGEPLQVVKVFKDTVHCYAWSVDDAKPGRRVILPREDALALRIAPVPRHILLGEVLIWGDKPCTVSAVDYAREEFLVTADWNDDGDVSEVAIPLCVEAMWQRFMRYPLPEERLAAALVKRPGPPSAVRDRAA